MEYDQKEIEAMPIERLEAISRYCTEQILRMSETSNTAHFMAVRGVVDYEISRQLSNIFIF